MLTQQFPSNCFCTIASGKLSIGTVLSLFSTSSMQAHCLFFKPDVDIFIPRKGGGKGTVLGFQEYTTKVSDCAKNYFKLSAECKDLSKRSTKKSRFKEDINQLKKGPNLLDGVRFRRSNVFGTTPGK
jgi:hypothetical protein